MRASPLSHTCLLALGGLLAAANAVAAVEDEPVIPAAELVSPALLAGPGYRVDPIAEVRGFQARFRIQTDWGEMEAELLVDVDKKEPTRVASSRGQAGRSGLHLDGFRRVWHRVLHSPPLKTGLSRPLRQSVGEKRYAENPSADPGSQ